MNHQKLKHHQKLDPRKKGGSNKDLVDLKINPKIIEKVKLKNINL